MRVPVFRDVHFSSFLAFQSLGVRSLCRRVHLRFRELLVFDSVPKVVMSLSCFKDWLV